MLDDDNICGENPFHINKEQKVKVEEEKKCETACRTQCGDSCGGKQGKKGKKDRKEKVSQKDQEWWKCCKCQVQRS